MLIEANQMRIKIIHIINWFRSEVIIVAEIALYKKLIIVKKNERNLKYINNIRIQMKVLSLNRYKIEHSPNNEHIIRNYNKILNNKILNNNNNKNNKAAKIPKIILSQINEINQSYQIPVKKTII